MSSHKAVLKNTLFLYVRMFLTIFVALYATRVVLSTLGETDFGIYNVIGGFVAMFSFITATMSNASTRYFSFELGRGDVLNQIGTFKVTFTIYVILIALILIIGETFGVWFVLNELNIPEDRQYASFWVYQFSILALIANIVRIPFNAAIIAHEKMDFYAYLSIVESVLKLLIVYLLVIADWDKLIFYSVLLTIVVTITTGVFFIYARHNFKECRLGFNFSSSRFKEILGYSGWNLASNFGDVMMDQGINVLLNIYFGPIVNAARGIAYNIKSVLMGFVGNFQMAASPQITKHFAASEIEPMNKLVIQTSKLSYYLMLILVSSVVFCTQKLLKIWLNEVPSYTLIFTYILYMEILVLAMGGTLNIAIQATGRIKKFVVVLSIIKLCNFLLVFLGFRYLQFNPQYALLMCVVNSVGCMFTKYIFYRRIINKTIRYMFDEILKREILVTFLAAIILLLLYITCYSSADIKSIVLTSLLAFMFVSAVIYYVGFNDLERRNAMSIIKAKLRK